MSLRRRRKSTPAKAASLVGSYLKLKTAGKAAKGAGKAAKGAGTAVVAYKGTKGLAKRLGIVAGAGAGVAAAVVGVRKLRGSGQPATG
jgi:hypothetical protein